MRSPKPTPLQSRLAASLGASLSLVLLYIIFFSSPRLAYAADVESADRGNSDAVEKGPSDIPGGYGLASLELMGRGLETLFGDHIVVRDVPKGVQVLSNNEAETPNIDPGETQHYVFPKEALAGPKSPPLGPAVRAEDGGDGISQDLNRRADDGNSTIPLYISLNTCLAPSSDSGETPGNKRVPQLKVYISQSNSIQKPGPDVDSSDQIVIEAEGGYVGTTFNATGGDVFIGVGAPKMDSFTDAYNYEIAASIDELYHGYNEISPDLYFVDSDSYTALLVTDDITNADPDDEEYKKWMDAAPPYTMFAQNINDTSISGFEKSYCGLNNLAKISKKTKNVEPGMTSRGRSSKPKEQFYITSLNESSTYYGFLATEPNNAVKASVGGGGKIWKAMNFTTKAGKRQLTISL